MNSIYWKKGLDMEILLEKVICFKCIPLLTGDNVDFSEQ